MSFLTVPINRPTGRVLATTQRGKVDRPGCNDKEYEHKHTATDEDPSWGAHPQAAGLWEQQRICERVLRGILNDGRR